MMSGIFCQYGAKLSGGFLDFVSLLEGEGAADASLGELGIELDRAIENLDRLGEFAIG